jgi:hypothetical protein
VSEVRSGGRVGAPGAASYLFFFSSALDRWNFGVAIAFMWRFRAEQPKPVNIMPQPHEPITYVPPIYIPPIACPHCLADAHVILRSPLPEARIEIRIFECSECGKQTDRTAQY